MSIDELNLRYKLAHNTIDEDDIRDLIEWLKTNPRLTMSSTLTPAFEKKWSEWVGTKYSVFCNSGSSANLLMYAVLRGIRSSTDLKLKVVVPSVGWITSIAPAMQLKGYGKLLMCEADQDTFGLDLNYLEDLLKKHNPQIVMLVQVLGVPHKMDEILVLQKRYGFYLLEDACAAAGSSYKGRRVGSFGDMSSISTYFGHAFSTIEGGVVSTNDESLYEKLLMLRSHGWDRDLSPERQTILRKIHGVDDFHAPFVFYEDGFNLRPTDLSARLGLRQLDKIDWLVRRRFENHCLYRKLLGSFLKFQKYNDDSVVCSIHFGALAASVEERTRIVRALRENGIETRIFSAGNLGRHPFWIREFGVWSAPIADRIHFTGFFLPNHPSLERKDVEFVSQIVIDAIHGRS